MMPDATELLNEWQDRAGERFRNHFRQAWSYFGQTVAELGSDEAQWTIAEHEKHAVLLLAGDAAFALMAFSGPPDGVTLKGALHPFHEGTVRVSFSDEPARDEVAVEGQLERVRPMVRRWSFDWHGRTPVSIEHWLPRQWGAVEPPLESTLRRHERQRAMAHRLARSAGWPMSPDSGTQPAQAG
jgi:hypothetical protein